MSFSQRRDRIRVAMKEMGDTSITAEHVAARIVDAFFPRQRKTVVLRCGLKVQYMGGEAGPLWQTSQYKEHVSLASVLVYSTGPTDADIRALVALMDNPWED